MYINFTYLFKKNNQNSNYSRYFLFVIFSLSIFINASSQYLGGNGGGNTMFYLPTAPSAPTNLQVSPANGELFINFTAGSDGGGAITNYKYSIDNGSTWFAFSPAITSSPVNIKYLTNATAYNVQLLAVNSGGDGVASTTVSGTPTSTYLSNLGSVSVVASGGDAEGSTWFYANKTIMPISSTAVNVNVADVLSKLASDLTITGSNININTNIVKSASSKLIFNTPGTINVAANITTDASVIYNGVVTTTGARTLTATKLWINGTLIGDNNITLNATSGNVVIMSNVITTGVFSATASANTFAMGVDLLTGRGATITADGGVSINASTSLLAGKVISNNTAINIAGNIQVAHFAATASPLLFDSRNGAINLTGGAVTSLTGESVDYALLVANAAKAVAETNVTISKVVSGSNRYLVYQYTTVGNDLFFTPYQVSSADYLVVAGGGGGGGSVYGAYAGGGGGGGGVANGTINLVAGMSKYLEVGAGGAIGANQSGSTPSTDGTNGSNSSLDYILAGGGGGAGASSSLISGSGRSGLNGNGGTLYTAGGGGGGVGSNNSATPGAGGIGSQRNGGAGAGKSLNEPGSGGPGGGAVGNASRGNDNAASGFGAGFASTITGTSIEYGKGSITYLYSRYNTIPGGGGAALSAYYGDNGSGNDGAVILRYLVGNETNHIVTNGLSIGNIGNTGDVINTSSVNLTGPITIHGTNLNINATLTSTTSDINLYTINTATQTAALSSIGLGLHGTGTFTLTNASNNVVNFAAGDNTSQPAGISFTDAAGGLTIGTVGTLSGTTSLGTILIETLSGPISVTQNITTSNTSANAVILNAGKNETIGTLTGGDIKIIGTSSITTGTGGIVKLFSGDPRTSTGLVNLAGGVPNARFLADETSTSFSPILALGNAYALFRGNPPTISATGTITPFVVCVGASSNEQTFIVAGTNLTANVDVTAPTGYEISLTSITGYTTTITLNAISNTVSNTTIYLRLRSDAVNGAYGNISVTSSGATTQNLATGVATVAVIPAVPITTTAINYTTGDTPLTLTATALSSHTLKWYTVATGGTSTTTAFTPTASSAGTQNYYVSQINTSGCESSRAQIVVTVSNPINTVQAPAGLTYATSNVFTVGRLITAINPTSTGGAITTYSVSPSLPAGLTLNTTTGIISGTPSGTASLTTYTIIGTNVSGTITTTISFAVNVAAPTSLSYTSSNVFIVGTAISSITPTSTGGAITTYSVSPSLPEGLSINSTTGVISGTPTIATPQGTYTITGTNVTGTVTTTLVFAVNVAAPTSLSYTNSNVFTLGTAISPITPTSTGGAITAYSVSPSLPAGLSFNSTTGVISGTPTIATPQGTYTITGTNISGTITTTISFAVNVAAPTSLTYTNSNVFTVGTAISLITPTSTGGAITTYSVSPSLPEGLSINSTTGVISGTPTIATPQGTYTITGTNVTGTVTTTISFAVNVAAPTSLSYTNSNVFTVGTAISLITPTSTGGAITTYSVSPSLPEGLSINSTTGVISGTPTTATPQGTYTITGTNVTGTVTTTLVFAVNVPAPILLSYGVTTTQVYTKGTTITTLSPTNKGGVITTYTVSPALPSGLSLDPSTGVISGVSNVPIATTDFVITGINISGTISTTITITILPHVDSVTGPTVICGNIPTQVFNKTIGGVWSSSNNQVATVDEIGIVKGVGEFDGTITITYTVTTDGISNTASYVMTYVAQPASPILMPLKDAIMYEPTNIQAREFGATYVWNEIENINISGVAYLSNRKIANPILVTNKDVKFEILITSKNGCVTTDTLHINVFKERGVYLPNAFTPNNDGVNDVFRINAIRIQSLNLFRIFDQWGIIIFETKNINEGWDGRFNGVRQPLATYTWLIDAIDEYGNNIKKSGSVTLIR